MSVPITIRNTASQTAGRQGRVPDFIVIHNTGGTTQSAINTIENAANQVSYHFLINPAGQIFRFVHPNNTAWHSGTNNTTGNQGNMHSLVPLIRQRAINANLFTIGIAFGDVHTTNGNPTSQALGACVALIRELRTEFTIPLNHIIGHRDVVPRHRPNCPGTAFPWATLNSILSQNTTPPNQSPPPSEALINELRAEITSLRNALSNSEARIAALENARNESNLRITDLENFRGENNTRIVALENTRNQHSEQIASLEGSRNQHNARVSSLESWRNQANQRAANLETARDEHNSRITTLENNQNETSIRINTMAEVPEWGISTVQRLIQRGALRGDGSGFNLTLDMLRIFVINDRLGLHN
ncbi:MAG: N-acetylmuramoyl-L-alanine amidase [Defluviitaleaceae bacterium]|nr:N-acetylmuramoyl-L-alanine amidase [Defluviitaleaceae bacterium]